MIGAPRGEILDPEIRRYRSQRQGIKASREYVALRPYPADGCDGRQQLNGWGDDRRGVGHRFGFLCASVASPITSPTAGTTIVVHFSGLRPPFVDNFLPIFTFAGARCCQPGPESSAGGRYELLRQGYQA